MAVPPWGPDARGPAPHGPGRLAVLMGRGAVPEEGCEGGCGHGGRGLAQAIAPAGDRPLPGSTGLTHRERVRGHRVAGRVQAVKYTVGLPWSNTWLPMLRHVGPRGGQAVL